MKWGDKKARRSGDFVNYVIIYFFLFVPGLPPARFRPCKVSAVKLNDPVLPFTDGTLEPVILPDHTIIVVLIHVPTSINVKTSDPITSSIRKCITCCVTLVHWHHHCSWLPCFSSLSLPPQYPRLVFPSTLPIILDVITHHNVTHKGKRLLRLETDPSLNLWSYSHRGPTDGPVFACLGFAENTSPPWNNNSICQIEGIGLFFRL